MTPISANLQAVLARIEAAARRFGRDPASISLLAVSKTWPAAAVRDAAAAGQRAFGENYVQETVEKVAELAALALEWHFIGPLQSNKTRPV
ncbi:MAG: YggS family pyridoxal phosphate enzyme, partial [Rhodocyclaceae bacterium]